MLSQRVGRCYHGGQRVLKILKSYNIKSEREREKQVSAFTYKLCQVLTQCTLGTFNSISRHMSTEIIVLLITDKFDRNYLLPTYNFKPTTRIQGKVVFQRTKCQADHPQIYVILANVLCIYKLNMVQHIQMNTHPVCVCGSGEQGIDIQMCLSDSSLRKNLLPTHGKYSQQITSRGQLLQGLPQLQTSNHPRL